jgi:murein DD-endopeptidase MepM/ murein hydrolase activator NlpD
MSRFARGLSKGDRVRQGQVIGYVGTSGLSTGPHLHYEVLKDGKPINPLTVKTIDTQRLAGAELRRFKRQATELAAFRHENDRQQTVAQTLD